MDSIAEYSIYDIDGTEKCKVVAEENSVYHVELMKSDYVKLCFKLYDKKSFGLGDYIYFQSDGSKQKFEITEIQKPTYDTETGSYSYELQFNAECYKWGNKKYKYEPKNVRFEASWALTDTLANHIEVLIRNLAYYGWDFTYNINDVANSTKSIYIQFDNISILDALTKIAEAFDTEWIVSDNIITLGRVELGSDIELEQGVNVEKISASNSSQSYVTTLYAFGSTNNLPSNYRKSDSQVLLNGVVQKRLMLPKETPYVQLAGVSHTEESVEGIVTFDDVYPKMDNKVTEVKAVEKTINATDTIEADAGTTTDATDETSTTTKVNLYRIKDSSLSFKKEYILEGVTLQAVFSTGKLAGMVFDLAFNPDGESETVEITTDDGTKTTSVNADSQWFELVRNNTYGVDLPNDTLKPAEGDKFVLIGWDATKMDKLGLIEDAEKALLERTKEYAKKLQIDPSTYTCTMMSDYMYGLNDGQQDENYSMVGKFSIGQRVLLKSEAFLKTGSRESRVIGFEYKLDFPYDSFQVIIGENTAYSYRKDLEATVNTKFDSINFRGGTYNNNGSGNGGSNLYVITTTDVTTPTDRNVLSALRTERDFAHKRKDDRISALWTFSHGHGAKRGVQSQDYDNKVNEDNLFGHGFELVEKTNSQGNTVSRLEIDELLVRTKAFFAELEVRKIAYVGGNYLFSSAGSKVYHVEWLLSDGSVLDKATHTADEAYTFRCYMYSDDGTTATMNGFAADDQVMCRTFNIDSGVHTNVSNKYWWRRCVGVGKGKIAGSDDDKEYQYVDISKADCLENSDYPEAEDVIVQIGNWTDKARQGAIFLMVYGDLAPAILEWENVGANGKHFVLPDPTIQISPKGNIFYGEFHSVAEKGTGGNGSIDDQINALIEQLNDIKNQADKKFEIWFGSGEPHPNSSTDTENNQPASEWTTEAEKGLHAQDLYYDTDKSPASKGGRAWRWMAHNSDSTVSYYWDEVTDKDTIDALEKAADLQNQVDDIVSDGVISRGSEKSSLLVEWNTACSNYNKYNEQVTDYSLRDDDVWKAFSNAFFAVATMLNNGADYTYPNVPTWINSDSITKDTVLADTPCHDAAEYRAKWNAYYESLAALLAAITKKAKELADGAQSTADKQKGRIDDIVSDEILDAAEKISVKKEFLSLWHEIVDDEGLFDKGKDGNGNFYSQDVELSCQGMTTSFEALGTYLNDGAKWELSSTGSFASVNDANTPAWIKAANMPTNTAIVADTYRTKWSDYYSAKAAYIGMLAKNAQESADNAQTTANGKANVFVSDNVPSQPYKRGDLWIQTANGNNVMICTVARTGTDAGVLSDWADLSDTYDFKGIRTLLASLAEKIYDISGGYIESRGKIRVYFNKDGIEVANGNIHYDNNIVKRCYLNTWETIDNASYTDAFACVYGVLGSCVLTVYSSKQSNASKYDLVIRKVNWHDPFKNENVAGNIEILMHNGTSWEMLRESTKAIIENLGDEIHGVVYGSDGEGGDIASGIRSVKGLTQLFSEKFTFDENGNITNIDRSGVVTTTNFDTWKNGELKGQLDDKLDISAFAGMYAKAVEADGTIVKTASMGVYVTKDGNNYISNAKIKADNIELEGLVTANSYFKVLEDGSIEASKAKISGDFSSGTDDAKITISNGEMYFSGRFDKNEFAPIKMQVSYWEDGASGLITVETVKGLPVIIGNEQIQVCNTRTDYVGPYNSREVDIYNYCLHGGSITFASFYNKTIDIQEAFFLKVGGTITLPPSWIGDNTRILVINSSVTIKAQSGQSILYQSEKSTTLYLECSLAEADFNVDNDGNYICKITKMV